VTVHPGIERWTEYKINELSSIGSFLGSNSVYELASAASDSTLERIPSIWAQSYVNGERISWHRDRYGKIHILVCLDAPHRSSGGLFCMRINGDEISLELRPGDALLFNAAEIEHSTTRLEGNEVDPNPRRITAVARFFAAGSAFGQPSKVCNFC
jgi:hypothetical protein